MKYMLFEKIAIITVFVQLQGVILMSFLNYSKQARMNFSILIE